MKLLTRTLVGSLLVAIGVSLSSAEMGKPDAVTAPPVGDNAVEVKVESVLSRMRELVRVRKWKDLVEQFKDVDIAAWPADFKDKSMAAVKVAEASDLRGQAFGFLKENERAEKDLRRAVDLAPDNGAFWYHLGDFCRDVLKDDSKALDAYIKVFECDGKTFGYMSISATLNAASILAGQGKYPEALKVMDRYDDSDIKKMQEMGPVWGTKMLEMNKRINAGLGRKEDSLLVLAAEGKTDYQIVVPDISPSPSIEASLKQVARLVQSAFKANGADVPVVVESARDSAKPAIYLGDTAFARTNGVAASRLDGWNYVHKIVGRDVIVAGREQPAAGAGRGNPVAVTCDRIGTAKAALDFLRLYAGTRFLYPDVPGWGDLRNDASVDWLKSSAVEFLSTPTIRVPADLDVRKTIPLKYNIAWGSSAGFYDLTVGRYPIVDEVMGVHTYGRAIPLEKYRETHPEYFALIGGKRLINPDGMEQYCIANPEVQELLYQDMIRWLDSGYEVVDIGQPDGFRPCQCGDCRKLFGTGDNWSEKLWILNRNLAERVLKARPGKQVSLYAYILTEVPPKTFKKFPANTRITLCGTNEEDLKAWRDYEVPLGFTSYIYNSCPNLGTRYTPMRTPRYVETQAKRFVSNRIQAIYRDGNGALYGLEGPVYYTMGRMFDDAERNHAKDLISEFCGGAFGKAAPAMLRFYDQLYHGIDLYAEYLGTRCPAWSYTDIYGRGQKTLTDPFQLLGFLYTPTLLAALEKDLAQAEKSADTYKAKTRLTLVRREFDYIRGLARVVHLYHAYEIQPDLVSRDRLFDAIDARNAEIDSFYSPNPMAGWAFTLFPINGHNAAHLRLAFDGYQEPFKNTCVNWDTKAMRKAPLPGAKRMSVTPGASAVSLDAPAGECAGATVLGGLPQETKPNRKTTLRMFYDTLGITVRVECELPANLMQTPADQEALMIYLSPSSGRDISYRFTVGPRPDAKTDAASGFVTDVMDPRYGQFDPDWTGDWSYEMRLEPASNRWLALIRVPYKTLGVEAPMAGTTWRGNFGRLHVSGPGQVERSLWSTTPNTKDMADRTVFGEIEFESSSGSGSAKSPAQVWREEYNAKHGEIPADWKKLSNSQLTTFGPWVFRTDPIDQGVRDGWFAVDSNLTEWTPVKVPAFWGETEAVGNYQGDGWYRTTFTVPEEWKGKACQLMFAGVDEQAWVYVNGKMIREHSVKSEGKSLNELWEESFTAEVPAAGLNYGKANVLVVRVNNAAANGGIWRPVFGHAVEVK